MYNLVSGSQTSLLYFTHQVADLDAIDAVVRDVSSMVDALSQDEAGPQVNIPSSLVHYWNLQFAISESVVAYGLISVETEGRHVHVGVAIWEIRPESVEKTQDRIRLSRSLVSMNGDERKRVCRQSESVVKSHPVDVLDMTYILLPILVWPHFPASFQLLCVISSDRPFF